MDVTRETSRPRITFFRKCRATIQKHYSPERMKLWRLNCEGRKALAIHQRKIREAALIKNLQSWVESEPTDAQIAFARMVQQAFKINDSNPVE